jgi:putative N6-adenine-specific DNA methylase
VVTTPGLEEVTGAELTALGLAPEAREVGGLEVRGTLPDLYALNLHLRTASRVLVRLARFRAVSFRELEARADDVEWGRVLRPGIGAAFDVTCHKSRLYHSGAVAERLARAADRAVPGVAAPEAPEAQRFVVRLVRNQLTLSADASGEHLHRRGYREATAKAPLRETLAAAVLAASGWTPGAALVDPLCGSGTLPIEAARHARCIPAGWDRDFAFRHWSDFDDTAWEELCTRARERMLASAPAPLLGSDRDVGAVEAARANAARAGVERDVVLGRRALSDAGPPDGWTGPGWLVTNPPYGRRIGERDPLRDLYARLGQVARARFPGWTLAVLTADPALARQVAPSGETALVTRTGSVPIRLHLWRGGA